MVSTLSIDTSAPSFWAFEVDQLSHTTDNGVATSMTEFYSYERNTSPSSTYDTNMESQEYSPGNTGNGFTNNDLLTDGTSTFRLSDLEQVYINQVTYADGTTETYSNQIFYTYTLTDLDTGETSFRVVPGGVGDTTDALKADIEVHGNIVSFGPVTSQSTVNNNGTHITNNDDLDLQGIMDSGVAVVDGFGTGGYDTPNSYVSSEAIAPNSNFFLLEVNANETQSGIDTIRANEFSQLGSGGTGAQADSLAMNEEIYNQTSEYYEKVVDTSGGGLWSVEQLTFADGTVVNYPGGSDNIRAARVETIDLNTGESHYYYSVYHDGNSTLLADLAAAHGPITNVDIGNGVGNLSSGDAAISRDIELDTSVVPNGIVDGEETGETMGVGYDDSGQATDGGGDIIDGADGDDDSIRGNGGDDSIFAGDGNDTIDGGADNDTIDGGDGNDEIYGGTGNDSLYAGLGSDTLYGEDGNDVLNTALLGTGSVDDEAYGGAGDDTVYSYYGDDTYDGGTGTDQINYSNLNAVSVVNLDLGAGTATLANGDVQTVTNFENAVGTFGDDTITGSGAANILEGGPSNGDDTLYGRGGDDTLLGGDGDGSLLGGTGDDYILGGTGADTIHGDESVAINRDELITNGTFTGNLDGWTSIDGNNDGTAPYNAGDMASFNSSNTPAGDSIEQDFTSTVGIEHTITLDLIENNSGDSTQTFQIDILDSDGSVVATETHTVANNSTENVSFTFTPTSDNSTLRITNTEFSNGGASDGKVDNVSIKATGPDTRTYNDSIDGGDNSDLIYGDIDNDTIAGSGAADDINGGYGDDVIHGGYDGITGLNTVTYTIAGGSVSSDDATSSFEVPDTLVSGQTFWVAVYEAPYIKGVQLRVNDLGDGQFTLQPVDAAYTNEADDSVFDAMEGDYDAIQAYFNDPNTALNNADVADTATDVGYGVDEITIGGVTHTGYLSEDTPTTFTREADGDDTIHGDLGNDNIDGDAGADTIYGDQGDDTLLGSAGDDSILGGIGNDTIDGGADNDIINGGIGDDNILGGTGDDVIHGDNGQGDTLLTNEFWEDGEGWQIKDRITSTPRDVEYDGDNANVTSTDSAGGRSYLVAPSEYNTSLSDAIGGTLDFDIKINDGTPLRTPSGAIEIDGVLNGAPVTIAYNDQITIADGAWSSNTVTLISDNFSIIGGDGSAVSDADFEEIMSSVSEFRLRSEYSNNAGDSTTFDNIVLKSGDALAGGESGNGTGNDIIDGGDGDDVIFGDGGDDSIQGGAGNDNIDGGAGNDVILGDAPSTGEFTVNQVFTNAAGVGGIDSTFDVSDGPGSLSVADADSTLEGSDTSGQTLSTAFDGHPVGSHVYTGGYYDVTNTTTGEVGRMYEVNVDEDYTGTGTPSADGTYYVFQNDMEVSPTDTITIDSALQPAGDVEFGNLLLGDFDDTIDGGTGDDTIDGGDGDDRISGGGNDYPTTTPDDTDNSAYVVILDGYGAPHATSTEYEASDYSYVTTASATPDAGDVVTFADGTTSTITGISIGPADVTYADGTTATSAGDYSYIELANGQVLLSTTEANDTLFEDDTHGGVASVSPTSINNAPTQWWINAHDGLGPDDMNLANVAGPGNDSLTGGAGNDTFIVAEGNDTITDFNTGNTGSITEKSTVAGFQDNNDFVDLSNYYNADTLAAYNAANPTNTYYNPIQWLQADQADGVLNDQEAGWDDNNTLTIQSDGAATDPSKLTYNNTNVVCFAKGTLIQTDAGEVPVETLRQGDIVLTRDHGYQALRWTGSNEVSAQRLADHPNMRPIRIRAGALGSNLPAQDLLVSQQHRILVSSKIAERMFDSREVLVAAKQLVMIDGIDVAYDVNSVEYFHFLFDRHEIVFSNGAETESLFTGPEALKAVSPEARTEILTLFPELSSIAYPATACRQIIKGRKGRQLAVRHKNKNKPLLELH